MEVGDRCEVFVGGSLVGMFDEEHLFARNALLVQLAEDPTCHLGKLGKAFNVSPEWLRQLRLRYAEGGLEALCPQKGGGQRKLDSRGLARLERLFAQGLTPSAAHAKFKRVSLSTIERAHRDWKTRRAASAASTGPVESAHDRTQTLPGIDMLPTATTEPTLAQPDAPTAEDDPMRAGAFVQHVGTWLMIGMLERLGLYAVAREVGAERVEDDVRLRVGLDAAVATFTIGEPTLEGVRRLRTPTAKLLLQSAHVPSPDGLRALMDALAISLGGAFMHFAMVRRYLEADDKLVEVERTTARVLYIDNHMRPYTGNRVVRKGWRMQDKRVRPGITDYYVHQENGRPLFRVDVPSHDSLPLWLMRIVIHLRAIIGNEERVLLAFDRGGAFPEIMAALRDEGVELATYERAPYPKLSSTAFTSSLEIDGETLRFVESRINLKSGRGRIRRIAVLDGDGRQINILAHGQEPAERMIEIMYGRWNQENAFKFGKERWGINQLDARKTTLVDPEEIIPNPARRRLDNELRATRIGEGDARCDLAEYPEDHPRHQRALADLDDALELERDLLALRPSVPKHAAVKDTELAGKLVRHDGLRKLVVDTIRIACANAESDLAMMLAPHMRKPREAKKLLANVFGSPGRVRVGTTTISVDLAPAANRGERRAIANLLRDVNGLRLTLPGDSRRRTLHFRSQLQ